MMNENKIIELLAEYLQKTDRMLGKMDQHEKIFDKQFERMDLAYQILISHSEKIEDLQNQTKEIQQRNEALLKEILSISKRVQTIEGKQ